MPAARCRVVREPLGAGPAPEQVAAGGGWTVALVGEWAGGGAVLTRDPVELSDDPQDLDRMPAIGQAAPDSVGGGWFGWLPYDGAPRLAFHDWVLRHTGGRWWFEALALDARRVAAARRVARAALRDTAAGPDAAAGPDTAGILGGADRDRHLAAVEAAIELIRAGEIYQVNIAARLRGTFRGSAAVLFRAGVADLHPRFGAYLRRGPDEVVGFSPELFLRRRGGTVDSEPIKGTAALTAPEAALRDSDKERAENLMIVDLVRNDLARVCDRVGVPVLFAVQRHVGVQHLVSAVRGTLRPGAGDGALVAAAFPPGSVTGAPKLRAVRAIADLEAGPRGAFTGAYGFASPAWGAEFAVAIRTFEIARERIELGVGGGITADSVPMLEWRECLTKAAPLLALLGAGCGPDPRPASAAQRAGGLLETVLAVDGRLVRAPDHLARLARSCRELYGAAPRVALARLARAAARVPGRCAVRVHVAPTLEVSVSAAPAPPAAGPSRLRTAARPAGLHRHKWSDRAALRPDTLYVAEDSAVLETERGNVFLVAPDGSLVTAPLRDDLLPGVTRRALLDLARDTGRPARLRTFGLAQLRRSAAFWTSSLGLAVPIAAVDGVPLPRRDDLVAAFAAALGSGGHSVR
ncbi:MAG: hypothetical protein EPN43_01500 [Jatrophihabitans sp.]|nr:MAG: hypothetical protein EPN43_01500 [Jatrophihabitans sp.]